MTNAQLMHNLIIINVFAMSNSHIFIIITVTVREDIIAELMAEPIIKIISKLAQGDINELELK